MNGSRLLFTALALCALSLPARAEISGTSTVTEGTGEFAGYWCYTVEFTWTSPNSLSNLSNFVGLDGLECACEPDLFRFPAPAGTTTGTEDGVECNIDYVGEYLCTGNPSLPEPLSSMAAVKFDPDPQTCDAGTSGSGSFTFCSLLAPSNLEIHPDVLVLKGGQGTVIGPVVGPLPAADCAVDTHEEGFGSLKSRF